MKGFAKAPGKIIITEAHFVIHGSNALAVAIEKETTTVAEISGTTVISSEPLGLVANIPNDIPSGLKPLALAITELLNYLNEKISKHSSFFKALCRSSSSLSELCVQYLQSNNLESAGSIMNFYQSALSWLGISTSELYRIVAALQYSTYGAKIIGAGGSGSVICLCNIKQAEELSKEVSKASYDVFSTNIPVKGVEVWVQKH